jgi:hypothetical protein
LKIAAPGELKAAAVSHQILERVSKICFVSGHGFSRAEEYQQNPAGL